MPAMPRKRNMKNNYVDFSMLFFRFVEYLLWFFYLSAVNVAENLRWTGRDHSGPPYSVGHHRQSGHEFLSILKMLISFKYLK